MKPAAALVASLLLAACSDAVVVNGRINSDTMQLVAQADPARPIEFTGKGGGVIEAKAIAQTMNMQQQCLRVRRPIVSAEVLVARLVNCLQIADPDAPLFGIHKVTIRNTRQVSMLGSLFLFGEMQTTGCLWWYERQPEAATNAIAYVSWNDLERECRP